MGELSGAQQQLQEALLLAFSTESALTQMLRFQLEVSLDVIAAPDPLGQRVFTLLGWAQSQGRLAELLRGVLAANPGNPALQAAARAVGAVRGAIRLPPGLLALKGRGFLARQNCDHF